MKIDRTWRKRGLAALLGALCLTLAACGGGAEGADGAGSGIIDLNTPDAIIAAEVGTTTESG